MNQERILSMWYTHTHTHTHTHTQFPCRWKDLHCVLIDWLTYPYISGNSERQNSVFTYCLIKKVFMNPSKWKPRLMSVIPDILLCISSQSNINTFLIAHYLWVSPFPVHIDYLMTGSKDLQWRQRHPPSLSLKPSIFVIYWSFITFDY